VALDVTSSATSTINGGALLRSAIGLLLTTGTVNATGLTVESNSVNGILLPNSGPGTATLSLASQIGHPYEQARAHGGLAVSYQGVGEHSQARRHWQEALRLYTTVGAQEVKQIRAQLAGSAAGAGRA